MSTTTGTSSTSALATSAPISFSGLSSGLNDTQIITELTQADSTQVTNLQTQQSAIQSQEGIYSQLGSDLQAFQTAAAALSQSSTFNSVSANSSNTSVATVTTDGTSLAGNYSLTVNQLAQAEKITSNAQTSATSALNLSGTFEIDGKAVSITTSNTLTSIAQAINGLGVGVNAGIVNGGTGNAYLSLTSSQTGAANQIQFADVNGSVLQSLGVGSSSTTVANTSGVNVTSASFSSQTTALGTVIGASPAGSFTINGTSVAVDLSTDSLDSIASKINAANAGATASVVSSTSNGSTTYSLKIAGTNGSAPTFSDGGNVLQTLGVLQQTPSNVITQAQDASVKLDNATITSSSNTLSTAIPGATITLLEGSNSDPGTTTLSLSQSTSGITSAVQNFVSAYNTVADYISSNSTLNTSTFATGPLFGDPVAQQVSNQLTTTLFQTVSGLTGNYTNLASIGLTLNEGGDLSLNSNTLQTALLTDPTGVANLFQATGSSTNSNISYISSGSSTVPSGTSGYPVNITQLATKAQYVSSTAQTQPSDNAELITFGGKLLGGNSYTIATQIGGTLQDTVNQINSDSKLSALLTASINSTGELQLDSKVYGTPGGFTVQSNLAASDSDTGIGTSSQSPTTAALDIAGTINGETATGSGQFLTGAKGNANTAGLEIGYTGSTLGGVGTLTFSNGIANQLNNLINQLNDPTNGVIAAAVQNEQSQYTDIGSNITDLQTQLTAETTNLTTEFNNMEAELGALQAQSKAIDALFNTSSSSSSSSSSGSSSSSSSNGTL